MSFSRHRVATQAAFPLMTLTRTMSYWPIVYSTKNFPSLMGHRYAHWYRIDIFIKVLNGSTESNLLLKMSSDIMKAVDTAIVPTHGKKNVLKKMAQIKDSRNNKFVILARVLNAVRLAYCQFVGLPPDPCNRTSSSFTLISSSVVDLSLSVTTSDKIRYRT